MMVLLLFAGCLFVGDDAVEGYIDSDGDKLYDVNVGGTDCDDEDREVGAPEVEAWRDADGDGLGDPDESRLVCAHGDGWVDNADDCDDSDPETGGRFIYYVDADGDGYGTDEPFEGCVWESGYVGQAGDCDDENADRNPGTFERTITDLDDDCDERDDDGLLEKVALSIISDVEGANVGASAVPVGDTDGDGFGDLAVGAPGVDTLYLIRGRADDREPGDHLVTEVSAARATFVGGASDELGASMAAGDLDGDAQLDLVVGAPGMSEATGGATVFLGPYNATLVPTLGLFGSAAGGRLGDAMAIGDATADGVADVLMGAPADDSLWLVPGPLTGTTDIEVAARASLVLRIEAEDDVERSLALTFADLDGDGIDELLVGQPWRDSTSRPGAGSVWICDGTFEGDRDIAQVCGGVVEGAGAADHLGTAVAVGDLDLDGALDVLAGAPGVDGTDTDIGAVYLFAGADTDFTKPVEAVAARWTLLGEEDEIEPTGGALGASLSVFGWVDEDDKPDFAVGAPNRRDEHEGTNVGAVYVVAGVLDAGTTSIADVADERFVCAYGYAEPSEKVPGGYDGCRAGTGLAPAGDIDADGLPDLLVGAPGWRYNAEIEVGAAVLVYGEHVQ